MAVTRPVFCFGLIFVFFMLHHGVFGDRTTSSENAYLRNTLERIQMKLGKMDGKLVTVNQGLQRLQQKINGLTRCQAPFVLMDGQCYLFSYMKKSWSDAQAYCRSKYANLATITSWRENDMIDSYVRNHFSSSSTWWVGGNDIAQEGRWVWVDTNRAISYTKWYPGQPDNHKGREDCLHLVLWTGDTYRWNDAPCDLANNFICEK